MLLKEFIDESTGPFIVPERHFLQRKITGLIDQDRGMHLAAGGDSRDPIGSIGDLLNDLPNAEDDSFPPESRTLLGPTIMRDDL